MQIALTGGMSLLVGCGLPLAFIDEFENAVSRVEWQRLPTDRAWISSPDALMLMERSHGRVAEQRIALPNDTALPGDNFIYLRTIHTDPPGGMRLERVLEQAGGLPGPFNEEDLGVMRTTEDAAGTLNWAEWTSGAGTACVLALRRLTIRVRVLRQGTSALDIVMRNCVRGTAQQALEPAGADLVVLPGTVRTVRPALQQPLSALAAPVP